MATVSPVTLKLKGEEKFKSIFGGIVTTFGRLAMITYVISSLIELADN